MRTLAISALAWLYVVILTMAPFAIALYCAIRYERRQTQHIDGIIRDERKRGQLPKPIDEFMRERALWKKYGWREFALFLALWITLELVTDFIRYNAHNIIREAHKISESFSRDD